MIELIHLTDPHLLGDPAGRLHGWAVGPAFDALWQQARRAHPDAAAIVLGGDLVDDLSPAGYSALNERLAQADCPVLAVAGNHDDPARMSSYLSHAIVHERLALDGWTLIGLDSNVPDAEHGTIGEQALADLDRQLTDGTEPALLVVHHPPVAVGTPWIDAMGLTDGPALASIVKRHPRVKAILAGHVHQAVATHLGNCPVWTTPSTMRQFQPGATNFAEDTAARPGYRHLQLSPDGRIETEVHRLSDDGQATA